MNRKWIEIALCLVVVIAVCAVLVGATYSQICKAKAELAGVQTKIQESETYEAELANTIAGLNQEKTTLEGQNEKLKADLDVTSKELVTAKEELDRIIALDKASEKIINELNSQVSQLQASYDATRGEHDAVVKERDETKQILVETRKHLDGCIVAYRNYVDKATKRFWKVKDPKDYGIPEPESFSMEQ